MKERILISFLEYKFFVLPAIAEIQFSIEK